MRMDCCESVLFHGSCRAIQGKQNFEFFSCTIDLKMNILGIIVKVNTSINIYSLMCSTTQRELTKEGIRDYLKEIRLWRCRAIEMGHSVPWK